METLERIGMWGSIILTLGGLWGIFAKAGRPGWAALVPFYNIYVLCGVCGVSGWVMILFFIPIINLLTWMFYIAPKLSKAFGGGLGTTIGLALIGMIFAPLLGWGEAQYQAPAAS